MDLNQLSTSDKIIGGTGIVLIIDLLFLPWHSVDLGFRTFTRSATESPNGFWGILALLVTVAVVAATLVRALKPDTKLPELPISWNQAIFYATVATLAMLLIKLISETEALGFASYLGVLLAGGMAFGGYQKFQADREGSSEPST